MGTVEIVTSIVLLMLVAALVRGGASKLNLPVSVLLFIVGLILALILDSYGEAVDSLFGLAISADIVLFVFLPTLIFESAMHFDLRSLGKNIGPILVLAVPGLLVSTFAVGGIVSSLTRIAFPTALLLGAILSATDPVAVLSVFQKLGAPKRLNTLVEGESLFNDAASLVLSKIIAGIVVGGALTFTDYVHGVGEFFYVFLGGAVVGILLGGGAILLLRLFSTDSPITITVTTILAYLSFLVAEHFLEVSGVIATLAAGLVFGSRGWMKLPEAVRSYIEYFWGYIAFLANALLFLLMGLRIELLTLVSEWQILAFLVLAMLIARGVVVFGVLPTYEAIHRGRPIAWSYKVVLLWGGLRGAVPIAIVLGLPATVGDPLMVSLVLGAVLFTLLFHGLTIQPVVRLLGLDKGVLSERLIETEGRLTAKEYAYERIPEFSEGGVFSPRIARELSGEYEERINVLKEQLRSIEHESEEGGVLSSIIMLQALRAESSLYRELLDRGHLGEIAYRQLVRQTEAQSEKVRRGGDVHDVRYGILHPKTLEENLRDLLHRTPGFRGVAERWRRRRLAIDYEVAWGHYEASRHVLEHLEATEGRELFPLPPIDAAREQYNRWHDKARAYLEEMAAEFPEFVTVTQRTLARRLTLLAELRSLEEQGEKGYLPLNVKERVQEELSTAIWRNRVRETAELETDPSELLKTVPLFSQLPAEEFGVIAGRMRPRTVNAGDLVVRQGDPGRTLFLVARGVVRVVKERRGERESLATLMAGDFFGEMAIIRETERSATVEAVSNCLLYELDRDSLFRLFDRYPAIRQAVERADRERRGE